MSNEPDRIAIAGDWHGNPAWARHAIEYAVDEGAEHIIHLGDFGYWSFANNRGSDTWQYLRRVNEALDKAGIDLWWLDGNHENHDDLALLRDKHGIDAPIQLPEWDHIHYLPRGYRWEWWGKTFMALGGAWSIDRFLRKEGKGWWPGELITDDQLAYAKREPSVSVIFSHDCPQGVNIPGIGPDSKPRGGADLWPLDMLAGAARHRERLREVLDVHWPRVWYHGHYHVAHETWLRNTKFVGLDCDGCKQMRLNVDIMDRLDFS